MRQTGLWEGEGLRELWNGLDAGISVGSGVSGESEGWGLGECSEVSG